MKILLILAVVQLASITTTEDQRQLDQDSIRFAEEDDLYWSARREYLRKKLEAGTFTARDCLPAYPRKPLDSTSFVRGWYLPGCLDCGTKSPATHKRICKNPYPFDLLDSTATKGFVIPDWLVETNFELFETKQIPQKVSQDSIIGCTLMVWGTIRVYRAKTRIYPEIPFDWSPGVLFQDHWQEVGI